MIDEKDREIIRILKEDSRTPGTEIGKRVHLPASTIYFRIRNLIADGTIKRFTIETNDLDEPDVLTLDALEALIKAHKAQSNEYRNETDLLWDALKACVRRMRKIEEGGH